MAKVRKNYELPVKHIEMLKELQELLQMGSEQEVIRYALAQCFYLESAIKKEKLWLVLKDQEGKERAIIFQ